jgi:hypothetical protein
MLQASLLHFSLHWHALASWGPQYGPWWSNDLLRGYCRVPTSAVEDLPAFAGGSAPRALVSLDQQQQLLAAVDGSFAAAQLQRQQQTRRQLLAFVPARSPPTRAVTDAWLAARHRRRGRQHRTSGTAEVASFGMDPNTGKLLPGGGNAAEQERPGSATPAGLLGDAELLAMPSLCTLGSGGSSGGRGGGSSMANTPASIACGQQQGAAPAGAGGGGSDHGSSSDEAGERVQPASPKYDERTFFFSNPYPIMNPTQHQQSVPRKALASTQAQRQGQQQQLGGGEETPAGQRLPRARSGQESAAREQLQQQRVSRLGALAAAEEQPSIQDTGKPFSSQQQQGELQGSPPLPAAQQQQGEQHQQRGSSALLKSVLKSAMKAAPPAAVVQGGVRSTEGSQDQPWLQHQQSQGSEGSGSGLKRVSFVAAGGGGQPGTKQIPLELIPAVPNQQLQQQSQQPAAAELPAVAACGTAAAAPSPLSSAGTAAATASTAPQRRQGFVSQITPPSPGLGGGAGPTSLSQAGFKQRRCVAGKGQQLTLLSLELHADCRWVVLTRYVASAHKALLFIFSIACADLRKDCWACLQGRIAAGPAI